MLYEYLDEFNVVLNTCQTLKFYYIWDKMINECGSRRKINNDEDELANVQDKYRKLT